MGGRKPFGTDQKRGRKYLEETKKNIDQYKNR